jgi:DNA-binding transcriptional regulator GbsR (MarR family)
VSRYTLAYVDEHVDELRALSRAAFGQKYRLECMIAIAESADGILTLNTLAETLNVSVSNIQDPIKALLATGLISPLNAGDSRSKFYVRNASAAWNWCHELAARAREAAVVSTARGSHD